MKSPPDTVKVTPVQQPYVGPRSIGPGEPLYGRHREVRELRDTLISQRIVFLYSPSGAGKSSLLEAGLRPQLEERGFHVLPTVRIGTEPDGPGNRYVRSLEASVREALPAGSAAAASAPDGGDVNSFLKWLIPQSVDSAKDACLFIDQFEELFTLDPADHDVKREFVRQLGVALRDDMLWVLISMREDFIAQLDPFLPLVPTRLSARYRLDLLDREAATQAARLPALNAGVEFSIEAAHRLVDDLRSIRVKRGDTVTTELGPHVEPVQLQVVCRRLWDRLSR